MAKTGRGGALYSEEESMMASDGGWEQERATARQVAEGAVKQGHLGKYYIINTYNNMYTLIYIPNRSLRRNFISLQK